MSAPVYCPLCYGDVVVLGQLGSLLWFRCRDCGAECSVREAEHDDG